MSSNGSSREGAGRTVLGVPLVVGLVIGLGLTVLVVGQAAGADRKVTELKAKCKATRSPTDQRDFLDQLKDLDTSESRAALEGVADGKDEMAAALALHTIGRSGYSGAATKLKAVFEDTTRSHAVRVAAFQGWARMEADNGTSWSTVERYAKAKTTADTAMRDSVLAVESVLFPTSSSR
ncbi:MAG: hypothetical protein K8T90_20125 [Planctomycetes bacterium]|nr:hypothetical protein [Planctomycetota bacterium]